MTDDKPILPCHPDACETCQGTDWDTANDVPCTDKSWCDAYDSNEKGGWYVCSERAGHPGPHYFEARGVLNLMKSKYGGAAKIDRDEQGLFICYVPGDETLVDIQLLVNGVRIRLPA